MTDAAAHFAEEAQGEPSGPGRYVHIDDLTSAEYVPGLTFRPVLGDGVMTNFVSFAHNTEAPRHVHEEEQIVIILDGEMTFDVAVIPAWVPHGAWTTDTTCLEVDVFCPPRKTLLALAETQQSAAPEADGQGGE
jgi:hypothetical protein